MYVNVTFSAILPVKISEKLVQKSVLSYDPDEMLEILYHKIEKILNPPEQFTLDEITYVESIDKPVFGADGRIIYRG